MQPFDIKRIGEFSYYAPRLLKIKTKPPHPQIIPFKFNTIQVKLDKLFEELLDAEGIVRVNVLKARREGVSTYVEGRIFHKVHTTPNTHAFIVAHDMDGLNTVFDMSKLFYDCLPVDYKPMKRYSSKRELVFENPNDKARFMDPGLRSKIEVFSANKVTASRSGGYSAAHFSEVAFYDFAEDLITSVVPSIPNVDGTFIVRESTANGKGNFFHDEWLMSRKGESNYHNIFFSWLDFIEYQSEFSCPEDRTEFEESLNEEEIMLIKKHEATLEQLLWRRYILRDYHGDVDKFHQEYPTTDDEAFITSGESYFSRERLREYESKTVGPIFQGEITGLGLVENDTGNLLIWAHPEKGVTYVLGVDVAGGDGGDNSTIEILKVPEGTPIIEQVAEYACNTIDPVMLAEKCIQLGRYYNEGMISPEIGNHGHTTLNEIKESYWNIYRWQYFDRFGKYQTNKLGWDCFSPDSRILTSDLQWLKADSIKEGMALVGFEEDIIPSRTTPSRRMNFQLVKGIKRFDAPRLKITLSDGNTIVVTPNHPFLWKTYNAGWLEAKDVSIGTQIKYLPMWETDRSYEAGRMSGLLDGEGHVSTGGSKYGISLAITQAIGPLADEIAELWSRLGFSIQFKYDRRFDMRHRQETTMMGLNKFQDIITALGKLRPSRLLRNFIENDLITRNTTRSFGEATVVEVEDIGKGEVIGIETSGHTLIVNGLLSHNTNVSTRPVLCDYTAACINADILVIRSEELVNEMLSFIKRPAAYGGIAEYGSQDDRILAFMIAVFTLAHVHQSASLLKELGIFGQPKVEEPEPVRATKGVDRDEFSALLEQDFGKQEVRSWLDY